MQNVFGDYDANIRSNDELSDALENYIGMFERGENVEHEKFFQLLNQAMERTKSDPDADEEKYDKLRQVAEKLYDVMKFKHPDAGLIMTLIKVFQKALLGSQRRHFHYRDKEWHNDVREVLGKYGIIEPTTVVPLSAGEKKKKEKGSSLKKKIKFR
jgi:hypothetical protein